MELHRDLDDVPNEDIYVVANKNALERGRVAGFNELRNGKYVNLMPRISKRDYADLQAVRLPESEGTLEDMLAYMPHMGAEVRAKFMTSHKAVVGKAGMDEAIFVVPRVVDSVDDEDLPPVDCPPPVDISGRAKKKTYQLSQFFSDVALYQKYEVTNRQANTVQRIAATKPVAAANLLQNLLNLEQTEFAIYVSAGELVRDRTQAKNTVRMMCKGLPNASSSIEAEVFPTEVMMYGPDGIHDWHVRGPLEYAYEVRDLYNFVSAHGPIQAGFILSLEMSMLRMAVFDGERYVADQMEYHTASPGDEIPVGFSGLRVEDITANQRVAIAAMSDRVLPVKARDGNQVASAVRVTERHVLINAHVATISGVCNVGDTQVHLHRQFGRDAWSAISQGTFDSAWKLREPVVGEQVVICYHRDGIVDFCSPLQVVSVEGLSLILSNSATVGSGISGGAVVALQDMALLGVHSGATVTNLVACIFSQAAFSEMLEDDSVSSISRYTDDDQFGNRLYKSYADRGLGPVLKSIMNSVIPVYMESQHVGMAVNYGGGLCTTCDAEMPLRLGDQKRVAMFKQNIGSVPVYTTNVEIQAHATEPIMTRSPSYFEKVFVVGRDSQAAYFSRQTSVCHVGVNARSFVIADVPGASAPLQGGLVVGSDGAVLGQCGIRSMTTVAGAGFQCWPLPATDVPLANDPVDTLKRVFPFLIPAAWPVGVVEEVFTHSSVAAYNNGRPFNKGQMPLANIGDNAAKAELYANLRENLVPHAEWSLLMQSRQSNQCYARAAHKFGFAKCMKLGKGVRFNEESKAYADLTEALLGAVYLFEKKETFSQLCSSMGFLTPKLEIGDMD